VKGGGHIFKGPAGEFILHDPADRRDEVEDERLSLPDDVIGQRELFTLLARASSSMAA